VLKGTNKKVQESRKTGRGGFANFRHNESHRIREGKACQPPGDQILQDQKNSGEGTESPGRLDQPVLAKSLRPVAGNEPSRGKPAGRKDGHSSRVPKEKERGCKNVPGKFECHFLDEAMAFQKAPRALQKLGPNSARSGWRIAHVV